MAISLTTDGLRLDYRTEVQTGVSGTYPIGTMMIARPSSGNNFSLPGTWIIIKPYEDSSSCYIGASFRVYTDHVVIRIL